ncbi:type IV toxin-antitoxin system AbiEi family antitoxin domain-containing protein [Nocardioides sp.]|uniref:type IV toxin-antitoxin system AbiEi family antitoxin domain-containing protein n=1 Tax=Nocardioides sp. TaxID=35761 RepID=UPI003D0C0202
MDHIDRLLVEQSGVISRRQAKARGLGDHDLRRLVRRKEWSPVHPGVYVTHTGGPSWQQRAWAAVLLCWPAALSHESALRVADGPGRRDEDSSQIHVVIERARHLVAVDGVRVHRAMGFADQVLWNLAPPRVRYDQALLDLAADAPTDLDALAVLADACGSRRTTAARLITAVAQRPRIARRRWLERVLDDIADGTCSVLEHGYLTRVERPHGLPRGHRQHADLVGGRRLYRDVEYVEHGLIVELDGRAHHDSARARDRDLDRDLDAALEERHTLRIGYGQVFERGCVTATKVGAVLNRRGWPGRVTTCALCG